MLTIFVDIAYRRNTSPPKWAISLEMRCQLVLHCASFKLHNCADYRNVTGVLNVPETKLLARIRIFVAVLFVALLNVVALYWMRPQPKVSLEAQTRCEAIFGLMDSLPTLPQFQHPISLHGTDTPAKWMTRALEIMDPYRVLFLQKEVHRGVRVAQENWAAFSDEHDCSWFASFLQPLWNQANARLDAEIRKQTTQFGQVRLAQLKELNLQRPMHFALNEKEWTARVATYGVQILKAADDKLMKIGRAHV